MESMRILTGGLGSVTIVRIAGRHGPVLDVQEAMRSTARVVDIEPVMTEFLPPEPVRQPVWSHELIREYWHPTKTEPPPARD